MALHPRQQIREAVKALLLGQTAAGSRVSETRVVTYRSAELPAISIYIPVESVEPEESRNTAPRELTRTAQLVVEGVVQQVGNVDDALDALALQIETAMHADETLGGKTDDSILESTDVTLTEDGDRLVGVVRLVYSVEYRTFAPEAVTLDDFNRAVVRYDKGGAVHEDNEAVDKVEVPGP